MSLDFNKSAKDKDVEGDRISALAKGLQIRWQISQLREQTCKDKSLPWQHRKTLPIQIYKLPTLRSRDWRQKTMTWQWKNKLWYLTWVLPWSKLPRLLRKEIPTKQSLRRSLKSEITNKRKRQALRKKMENSKPSSKNWTKNWRWARKNLVRQLSQPS